MNDPQTAPQLYDGPAGPCSIVIFGASGDLTKRKLLPALYHLQTQGLLPKDFAILGGGRSAMTDDEFRAIARKAIEEHASEAKDPAQLARFENELHYFHVDYDDVETFTELKQLLEKIDRENGTRGNYMFYLAVPPSSFASIVGCLGEVGLLREEDGHWRRVIIEKPFGQDLESSRALHAKLSEHLHESQTYRIDHYLGKETVQNLLVFRFGNGIFEPVWNRRYIDHVQITVSESLGVESRGGFYEKTGAMRDVMQNHMFMLMSLVAMEPPTSLIGESVRSEKTKVFEAIRPMQPNEVARETVRAQYTPGTVDGKQLPGYREEKDVSPDSTIETYAAARLCVENWRWAGVPFYLRTGKRLAGKSTQILIQFNPAPLMLYGSQHERIGPNRLIISIQPCESITLQVRAKTPGPSIHTQAVSLNFDYQDLGGPRNTGYETLLYDCMVGDQTLFHRIDTVEGAWKVATPILDAWQAQGQQGLHTYAAGTWGPQAADDLIAEEGHYWWRPEC